MLDDFLSGHQLRQLLPHAVERGQLPLRVTRSSSACLRARCHIFQRRDHARFAIEFQTANAETDPKDRSVSAAHAYFEAMQFALLSHALHQFPDPDIAA